jgi:hypothetical protein
VSTHQYICYNDGLFSLLKSNNYLANLTLNMMLRTPQFLYLANALQHNTALQYLTLILVHVNWKNLKPVLDVFNYGSIHLKELKITIMCFNSGCYKKYQRYLDSGSRVVIGPGFHPSFPYQDLKDMVFPVLLHLLKKLSNSCAKGLSLIFIKGIYLECKMFSPCRVRSCYYPIVSACNTALFISYSW